MVTEHGITGVSVSKEFQWQAVDIVKAMAHEWIDQKGAEGLKATLHYMVDHLPRPGILWVSEVCPHTPEWNSVILYTEEGGKLECYAGLFFDWGHIFIADRDRIWKTSFAHEMGHGYRRLFMGDGDGEHLDKDWWVFWEQVVGTVIHRLESVHYKE